MTERMDLIVPADVAQLVVRYKPGDLARCANEIGAALIDLKASIFVRGEDRSAACIGVTSKMFIGRSTTSRSRAWRHRSGCAVNGGMNGSAGMKRAGRQAEWW